MMSDHTKTTSGKLPDFIVIGEMRCGSTTIWDMLNRHSEVFFPEEKELHFFDNRNGRWEKGVEWYQNNFKNAGEGMIVGEATPDYLFHEAACERIYDTVPHAKLVVILRDPVERAWSHYWHNMRRGRETLSFREAIEAEEEKMMSSDLDIRSHYSYATRGHYIERLKVFEKRFGKDSLCVVFLEDLKKEPKKTMEQVCAHLGISFEEKMTATKPPQKNKASYPSWPKLNAKLQTIKRIAKKTKVLSAPAELVAKFTRPMRTYSGQSRMDQDLVDALSAQYCESNKRLSDWTACQVPWSVSEEGRQKVS